MYKVYDDILTPEEQRDFAKLITSNDFPFYWIDTPEQTSVDNYIQDKWGDENTLESKVMVHTFMQDGVSNSNMFDRVEHIINKFVSKTSNKITELFGVRLNLEFQSPNFDNNKYHCPHKDQDFEHQVLLYYPFTSDGDTFIFNEIKPNKYEVVDRIKPIGGRFLLMNSIFHAGQPPIINPTRMTLNYNAR
tara:strand:+ start:75 stop:644 length:570 start_codon:yes stop_codon:yes gene_type:complete